MFGKSLSLIAVATVTAATLVFPSSAAATPSPGVTPTPAPTAPVTPTATPPTTSQPATPPATSTKPAPPKTPDLAAIGTTVRTAGADYVKLRVGVRNVGRVPLVLRPDTATEHPVIAYIYLPGNTFGSDVPYRCAGWGGTPDGWDWLDPGRPSNSYACLGTTIQPGATDWIELTVKVRNERPATPGYIRVGVTNPNDSNDKAAITALTGATPATPTTRAASSGLPTTGTPLAPLVAAALTLVVAGVLALWSAKSHRTPRRPAPPAS